MKILKGIPSARGMVYAPVVAAKVKTGQQKSEMTLEEAVAACVERTRALYEKTQRELDEQSAEIFAAYEMLLTDEYLLGYIRDRVSQGKTLPVAVETVLDEQAEQFGRAKSEYMRQRAEDIRNIKTMLLQTLENKQINMTVPEGDAKFILAADSLSPADTMSMDTGRLAGLVTRLGGATSHVVILAKMLGIPAVTGLEDIAMIPEGEMAVLDGNQGQMILEPEDSVLLAVSEWQRLENEKSELYKKLPKGEVTTVDGETVHVSINIGSAKELENIDMQNVRGVGLYRTEFLYSERETLPTLQEQINEYKKVFDLLGDKELVVRTLDIGGDKEIPYLNLPKEENPFLGCRGIRLCFKNETLLRNQFEALLRAACGRKFSIMFPMVNTVGEFLHAKNIWNQVKEKLVESGIEISDQIQLGVMIETPAAALSVDLFVRHVDFASIGTNDLTQYVLAADRGNPNVGTSVSYMSPAVIRIISHVISTFHKKGVKISVCGEAGSDEIFLKFLIGMGLRYTSVSVSMIDRIRYAIVNTHAGQKNSQLSEILQAGSEEEVLELIQAYEKKS